MTTRKTPSCTSGLIPAGIRPTGANRVRITSYNVCYTKLLRCQELDPDTSRPYSARYIGSLVSDFHRNLLKGDIYIYPQAVNYPNGKLRLLYECNPIAFLAEQAGGRAFV